MNRLKELREQKGVTIRQLEKITGIPNATISLIENGKQPFREVHITKFCDYFGVSPNYLLGKEDDTPSREHMLGHIILKLSSLDDKKLKSVYQLLNE